MDKTDKTKEAIKDAVELIKQCAAVRRCENISYALVVKVGYEDIRQIRNDGYSFKVICEAFISKGLLDERARPEPLALAFRREAKRRAKRREHDKQSQIENRQTENSKPEKEVVETAKKNQYQKPQTEVEAKEPKILRNNKDNQETREETDEERAERLKKLLAGTQPKIDPISGVRTLSNGSFDF